MKQNRKHFIDGLHIFILFNLALSKPLYVMSRNAEFFLGHRSTPLDIILFVIIQCLILPALFVLFESLAHLISRRFQKVIHYLFVAFLLMIIAMIALKRNTGFSGDAILLSSFVIGVMFTICYARISALRRLLTILLPAVFIFPYLFLFQSPIYKVAFAKEKDALSEIKINNPAPIVMVVFDEFPSTSLMDGNQEIDKVRYPNFSALAEDAYWFRNATTVADSTVYAVPAILTGRYPDFNKLPIMVDYPENLFTLLKGSYIIDSYESLTMLSPEKNTDQQGFKKGLLNRLYPMLLDLSMVYLHIILPVEYSVKLPPVTQTWKNFWNKKGSMFKDRKEVFNGFLSSITKTDRPALHFLHIMLPHVPWEYLPSGRRYANRSYLPGLDTIKERWDNDEWLVTQAYQRHLLQVGFVDKLLGDLIKRLKEIDLYEPSLIIITADHGVSFRPDDYRRPVTESNFQDIMPMPLFIKLPYQKEGVIKDDNVETVDILPTIADVLEIKLPYNVDGDSVFHTDILARKKKQIYSIGRRKNLFFEPSTFIKAREVSLKKKIELFGQGDIDRLFRTGTYNSLIGKRLEDLQGIDNKKIKVTLKQQYLLHIKPETEIIPSLLTGEIQGYKGLSIPLYLALAINGRIYSVTKTFDYKKDKALFSALVPPYAFRVGNNDVDVFVVSESNGTISLIKTDKEEPRYFIKKKGGKEIIEASNGLLIPIKQGYITGYIDTIRIKDNLISVMGWAADIRNSRLPYRIVVFVNGEAYYSKTDIPRRDVVDVYDNDALYRSGFNITISGDAPVHKLRVFAISEEGIASELNYPEGFRSR